MKCQKCGQESRIRENDKFCHECGFPLGVTSHDGEPQKLNSVFVDVASGVMLINGEEVNNVTAFSFVFENGKYGLVVTYDDYYEASVQLGKQEEVS